MKTTSTLFLSINLLLIRKANILAYFLLPLSPFSSTRCPFILRYFLPSHLLLSHLFSFLHWPQVNLPVRARLVTYVAEWSWLFQVIPPSSSLSVSLNWSQRSGLSELPIGPSFSVGSQTLTFGVCYFFFILLLTLWILVFHYPLFIFLFWLNK